MKEAFANIAEQKTEKIFFCHAESGKAHAFAARKESQKPKGVVLLDSLLNRRTFVPNCKELFENNNFAGRASVMIVSDPTRQSKILTEITI